MASLQAIQNERSSNHTGRTFAVLTQIAHALRPSGGDNGRNTNVDAAGWEPGERSRREIARVTGVYHCAGTDRAVTEGQILRAARHLF